MAIRFLACLVLVARLFTDSGVALGRELASTKISPSRGRFEVLCRVDQREQKLLFDTGSADCCLTREFCERHLTLHGRVAVSAAKEVYFSDHFKGGTLAFDQMTVSQPLIIVHDRRSLPRCGIGSDGLMGMSIFADKVIQLDWKQGSLKVFDQYDPEEGDEALELRLLYGVPSIRGRLSGWRDFIVDTGNEAPMSLTPVLRDVKSSYFPLLVLSDVLKGGIAFSFENCASGLSACPTFRAFRSTITRWARRCCRGFESRSISRTRKRISSPGLICRIAIRPMPRDCC